MFLNGKRRGRVNLKSDLERSEKNRVKEREGEGEGEGGREGEKWIRGEVEEIKKSD